jgi:hypothetical protein
MNMQKRRRLMLRREEFEAALRTIDVARAKVLIAQNLNDADLEQQKQHEALQADAIAGCDIGKMKQAAQGVEIAREQVDRTNLALWAAETEMMNIYRQMVVPAWEDFSALCEEYQQWRSTCSGTEAG